MCDELIGSSGKPARAATGIPCLVLLEPKKEIESGKLKLDPGDKDSVRLWAVNHIKNFYITDNPDGDWTPPFRTDFDGTVVEFKGKRWAFPPGFREKQFHVHFTTIPLVSADVKAVCKAYGVKEPLEAKQERAKRPYEEDPEEFFKEPLYVIKISTGILPRKAGVGKMSYWETVMYQESTDKALNKFRDLQAKKLFTEADLTQLKTLLDQMRGEKVFKLVGDKDKNYEYPGDYLPLNLPQRLYDPAKVPGGTIFHPGRGISTSGPDEGPYWLCCESKDIATAATKTEDSVETPAEEPPPIVGATIALYKMNKSYRKPRSVDFLPPIENKIIKEIKDEIDIKLNNKQIFEKIKKKFKNAKDSVYGKHAQFYREHWKEISKYFYFGEAESYNSSIMYALDGAATHWKCHLESRSEDFMKSEKSDTQITIRTNVVVGFATGSDGFSESITPKHVYYQLKDWWDNLCDTDKKEIFQSSEINVIGYTSMLGGETPVNIDLRENRSWRTAKSLQLLLENQSGFDKQLELIPFSKTGIVNKNKIPLSYGGREDMSAFPSQHLPHLFSPAGSTICDLHIKNDPLASKAVKQVDTKNNPKDRIALIIFTRKLQRETTQFVSIKGNFNAAHVLSSYRVLLYEPNRVLVYAIPGTWK